jgi:monoamine oxidase
MGILMEEEQNGRLSELRDRFADVIARIRNNREKLNASREIAVIGGGPSGLVSAYRLSEQGYKVTVIEAAGLLGGHMQTSKSGFDLGAQLISTREQGLIQLANELGVKFDPPYEEHAGETPSEAFAEVEEEEPTKFVVNGRAYSEEELSAAYEPLADYIYPLQLQLRDANGQFTDIARQLDSMSMQEFLDEKAQLLPPENRDLVHTVLKQAMHTEFGDPNRLSALAFVDYVGAKEVDGIFNVLGESDEAYVFADGAGSLIKALEAKLKERGVTFATNTRVTGLENGEHGINVQTQSQEGVESKRYDYVVSALSLENLRHVSGLDTLGLSPGQMDAIHNVEYANLVKINVPTKDASFNHQVYMDLKAEGESGQIVAWQNGEGVGSETGSITFYCADIELGEPGETRETLIDQMKKKYAQATDKNAQTTNKNASDVFAEGGIEIADWRGAGRGCFSMPTKGQYINQHSLIDQSNLTAPIGFATEAIPVVYKSENSARGFTSNTGCMNNAVESANRAAERGIELMQERTRSQELATARRNWDWRETVARGQNGPGGHIAPS